MTAGHTPPFSPSRNVFSLRPGSLLSGGSRGSLLLSLKGFWQAQIEVCAADFALELAHA